MARRVIPLVLLLPLVVATAWVQGRGDAAPQATDDPRCGSRRTPATGLARRPVPRLDRVVVVVMENKACEDVIGSANGPFVRSLARNYAFASRYYAITRPSLPNYLALTGGSTFGITVNCTACTVRAPSLIDQLERAGISWKGYMEAMPTPCFRGYEAGRYVKKHNPFAYYARVTSRPRRCGRIVPLDRLAQDVRGHRLPRFVWITPDLCHDTHDCSVRTGDRFLSALVPPILRVLGPNGVLVLTWDEGTDDAGCCRLAYGGNVATVVAGPAARAGGRSGLEYDHYSLLRTIEDGFGLPRLRGAACPCTRPLGALLR